ncbi:hypothetical protein [Propionivibrio dicarboxylicus]|uniref:SpoIIAA-like n=1 Tax=Propionivibrio dicarboxylicus TaxID=83767 RepID=A0A1G8JA16_9RHOO|nr:hypothetical protein [Propionivibrio dicarboxylicus]SDI28085.1 hypothetical protein SAMN05660652_03154 [Propionivibrio dicarboxylicus]
MSYEITWESRGVFKKLSGYVSADEYGQSVDVVQTDARFDELRYIIVDATGITGDDFTGEKLDEIACLKHVAHRSNTQCPVAYIVTSGRLARMIMQATLSIRKLMTIAIFPSVEDARHWFLALRHGTAHR